MLVTGHGSGAEGLALWKAACMGGHGPGSCVSKGSGRKRSSEGPRAEAEVREKGQL